MSARDRKLVVIRRMLPGNWRSTAFRASMYAATSAPERRFWRYANDAAVRERPDSKRLMDLPMAWSDQWSKDPAQATFSSANSALP
jgi:hypothetical protein